MEKKVIAKIAELAEGMPVWGEWAGSLGYEYTKKLFLELDNLEADKSAGGRPRSPKLPWVVLLSTAYPRGIETTEQLGKIVGVSGAQVRKWRRTPWFRKWLQECEGLFALWLVAGLEDGAFIRKLYSVEGEPFGWSDNALLIFVHATMEGVNRRAGRLAATEDWTAGKAEFREIFKKSMPNMEHLLELKAALPEPSGDELEDAFLFGSLVDLAGSAMIAFQARPGRPGKKPYDQVRMASWEMMVKEVFGDLEERALTKLVGLRDAIDRGLEKAELLKRVDSALFIASLLRFSKADSVSARTEAAESYLKIKSSFEGDRNGEEEEG